MRRTSLHLLYFNHFTPSAIVEEEKQPQPQGGSLDKIMGFVDTEGNGSGDMDVSLGSKNKYKRMDSELSDEFDDVFDHFQQVERSRRTKKYVLTCAIFASLNTVVLGYDIGVMSGAIIFIQEDLKITEAQEEVLVGILSVISLLGSLMGGKTSDMIGRKWTIALAALVFQIGMAIMAIAPSYQILMAGRLITGVGIGFGVMISPVYIAEISPTSARGFLTSIPEISISFGILLGYVSNYAFSGLPTHINWRIMLVMGILPSVFIGVALFVIPESPRWLVMQNRVEEARLVLSSTNDTEAEVEERLAEIKLSAGIGNGADNNDDKGVWRQILNPSPSLRRMLITGFGLQLFGNLSGLDTMIYYSPEIFKAAGVANNSKLLALTVAVGVTKAAFIPFATFNMDRIGRKPLLYISTTGMTICLFTLGLSLVLLGEGQFKIAMAVLSVCGNVAFFSVGMGSVGWVLISEIYPLKFRAQASAFVTIGGRVSSGIVSMTFLSVSQKITYGGTFTIFSVFSALTVLFVHTHVPETKGKSLEQIELLFQDQSDSLVGDVEMEDTEHLVQKA